MQTTVEQGRLDKHASDIIALAETLRNLPEPGYGEKKTVEVWRAFAKHHSLPFDTFLDGQAPLIQLGDPKQAVTRIAVTADLDAVGVRRQGALAWEHLCGHHAQSAHALGLALLVKEQGLSPRLSIRLVGCPAEECMPAYDREYPLPFVPGKRRLLTAGCFSGVTAVLGTHLADDAPERSVILSHGAHGGIWLRVRESATAGAPPYTDGRENAVRQSLAPILGAHAVAVRLADACENGVDVRVETAPHGGEAVPHGGRVADQLTLGGMPAMLVAEYVPLVHDDVLRGIARRLLREQERAGGLRMIDQIWLPGVTDLGYVGSAIPTLQVFVGGTKGETHSPEFRVVDPYFAYVWPGWFLYAMAEAVHRAAMGA